MYRITLVTIAFVALSGCAASIGGRGPIGLQGAPGVAGAPGSAGPAGPQGPVNAGPQLQKMLRTAVDITVPADIDVVITEGAAVSVRLPPAVGGNGRTITIRAFGGRARVVAGNADQIDSSASHAIDRGEMITVISDGDRRWVIIGSSDL